MLIPGNVFVGGNGLGQTDILDTTPGTGIAPSSSLVWIGLLALLGLPWLIRMLGPAETTRYSRRSYATRSRRSSKRRSDSSESETESQALARVRAHGAKLLGRG